MTDSEDETEKEPEEQGNSEESADNNSEETAGEDGKIQLNLDLRHVVLGVFALGLAIGFAGGLATPVVVGGNSQTQGSPQPTGNPSGEKGSDSTVPISFEIEGEPVLGQKDAPVTIVSWEDFQCPFCKRFEQQTFPKIKENYIKTGKVRVVFKDYAFLGPDSKTAGIASECVWKQVGNSNPEAYWRWNAEMFDKQDGENSGWGDKQDIINMTKTIEGIDAQQLSTCMANNQQKFSQEISQDQREGQSAGITGTPGFVIYRTGADKGTKLIGAQPYNRFKSVIESALQG
ncbi:MAG: DsbA family protein [Candidatus Nanosalina sp.]